MGEEGEMAKGRLARLEESEQERTLHERRRTHEAYVERGERKREGNDRVRAVLVDRVRELLEA